MGAKFFMTDTRYGVLRLTLGDGITQADIPRGWGRSIAAQMRNFRELIDAGFVEEVDGRFRATAKGVAYVTDTNQ